MGFHHIAFATNDIRATHRFYTEAMGFTVVKVVAAPTPSGKGWAKHVFYDTGNGEMIAFWDLHDPTIPEGSCAISTGLGFPDWVNHFAFSATLDQLDAYRDRWLDHGYDVVWVDHGFCISIYATDPNGILVEFCADTRALDEQDRDHAERNVLLDDPEMETEVPGIEFFMAADHQPVAAH